MPRGIKGSGPYSKVNDPGDNELPRRKQRRKARKSKPALAKSLGTGILAASIRHACSACDMNVEVDFAYCPWCGAKFEEEGGNG